MFIVYIQYTVYWSENSISHIMRFKSQILRNTNVQFFLKYFKINVYIKMNIIFIHK